MRVVLLAAAASLAALAAPAAALDRSGAQFSARGAAAVTVHRNGSGHVTGGFPRGLSGDGDRHDRRRHRGGDGDIFFGEREYQGDSAFRPEGFNDWWHERPWRSYPRWVQSNDGCEREWQGGGVWRCTW
jgi:hypothetical protein